MLFSKPRIELTVEVERIVEVEDIKLSADRRVFFYVL
jgi:hypothetical protein